MRTERWLDRLVTGATSPESFVAWLAERFGATLEVSDICALFAADVERRLPGVDPLVRALQGRYRLAILSNTFFGHWEHLTRDPFYEAFDVPMASHLLGAAKPDARIFERALSKLAADPQQVVFVDDAAANVEAARALGMPSVHATDVDATRAGLRALSLL